MPGEPGITNGVNSWRVQDNYVERLLDNAALTSAHPDDTLVLFGPARFTATNGQGNDFASNLLACGMLQNFSYQSSKPTQPLMSIGSGRQFFVSGKSQNGFNMSRLFVNGRNLLRALYTNAVQAGIDVAAFDDPAASASPSEEFWLNLDSELFLIPFGIAVLFRDKIHNSIGAFYMELCMINSHSIGFAAGSNLILENVAGVCDRVLPIYPSTFTQIAANPASYPSTSTLDQNVLDLPGPAGSEFGDISSQ
jgi:hypothetical protein